MSVVKRTGFKISTALNKASNSSTVKIRLGFLFYTAEAFALPLSYFVKKASLARVEGPRRSQRIEFSIKDLSMNVVRMMPATYYFLILIGKF